MKSKHIRIATWSFAAFVSFASLTSNVSFAQESSETTPKPLEETSPKPISEETPKLFQVHLADGMEIVGRLSIAELQVDTDFGPLRVPVEKLKKFTPGLASRDELRTQIQQWIDDLGAANAPQREAGQLALINLGLKVRSEILRYRNDKDAERANRIKTILENFDKQVGDLDEEELKELEQKSWSQDDRIESSKFTILGKIVQEQFELESKYGTITIDISDIQSIREVTNKPEDVSKSLTVNGDNLAQKKFKSTGVRVSKGDKVTVRATGQIQRSGSSSYISGPNGSSRFGQYLPNIIGGSLVAKIGQGGAIRVGSQSTFTAKQSGTLQFAIGMRPDYVGRYQFTGEYKLRVKVVRGGQ